ncbi:hypothetical protein A6A08_17035 [Nocardiopsis sp. TSRI0078]|uniref:hypothetical protein n=1 Tax=unclassified Nocardiopsis TaxID=2649073 RepID=UPI00093B6871|nr:hypothetical protein [Nocardiopsis sp. TSRI0078]OKI12275.1 hypothetical protein A6A08_17035 [Nocardiopsis sp. TSRI0078]
MTSSAFAAFALAHLCLTVWLVRLALVRRSTHTWLVAAVAAGLVYDNAIVALGSSLGAGDLLLALNLPRFVVHALVTPLLVVFAVGAARDLGLAWARTRVAHAGFSVLAAALVVYGVVVDLVGLTLVPGRGGDALRYSAAEPAVPVPSVATIVVLVLVGAALLVRARSGWMLLGAATMFAVSAVPHAPLVVGNLGEVALIAGLALTARHMGSDPTPA